VCLCVYFDKTIRDDSQSLYSITSSARASSVGG
jgi:hypothetical protein